MKKKLITAIISMVMAGTLIAGCGGAGQAASSASASSGSVPAAASQAESAADAQKLESAGSDADLDIQPMEPIPDLPTITPAAFESDAGTMASGNTLENASFVMIYNPMIYEEQNEQKISLTSLSTGDLSSQIVTGMNRAGELEDAIKDVPKLISQAEANKDVKMDEVNREGGKAGGLTPVYNKGDTHEFYCTASNPNQRMPETFECVYVGEHCYIWSWNNSISEADAETAAKEFDTNAYPQDTAKFGQGRFTDNGGKVNILFYPLAGGAEGYFYIPDIFSAMEIMPDAVQKLGANTDHAVININSDHFAEKVRSKSATMAHEFQHLICASDCCVNITAPLMKTWLNEAMSAYAEEMVYPGVKEEGEYNLMMYVSDPFRKGQSLYNFSVENDQYIGAYGAVYLFSQYIEEHSGPDVFSNVHEYWRNTMDGSISEAAALAKSVTPEFYSEIDQKYSYPSEISSSFASGEEEWMSKLALDFYLETLSAKLANREDLEDPLRASMLYSEMEPQTIQGGGRMIVATENGSYTVPADADKGLIYIGLDSDFNYIPGNMIVG